MTIVNDFGYSEDDLDLENRIVSTSYTAEAQEIPQEDIHLQ